MSTRLACACVVASLTSGACTTHSGPPISGGLQMNDLSVMFPLPQSQGDLTAMLAPTAAGNGGQLFPQTVHDSAGTDVAYENLVAVAFRLDPCFGQLGAITDPSSCKNQLRVVFQPIALDTNGSAFVQDAAIHAFYSITREQLLQAVDEIIAAREAAGGTTDLGPLAPNTLIAKQGLTGTLAQALESMITENAGSANLERFTSFAVELLDAPAGDIAGAGEFWTFQSFDVAAGSATPRTIPTLPQAPTSPSAMSLGAGVNPLETTFSPATTSNDNLDVLASYSQAMAASAAVRTSAFDSALRILNPSDNSPDTIDCASCHMAQPAIQLVGAQLGMTSQGNTDAFSPDIGIPRADLAQTTTLVDDNIGLNIHAFSYRSQSPMINQRVINETAANLSYISTLR